ncbi:MAG: GumC family protein [Kofleriaceae bacterium]
MSAQQELQEPADGEQVFQFDIGRYFRALRRYAWILVALVAIAATGAVFYTRQQPKIYEAVASVQIEPKMTDLLNHGDLIGGGGGGGAEYYKQQRQVLGSLRLLRETVVTLNLQKKLLSGSELTLPLDKQYDVAAARLHKAVTIKYPEQNRIMYVAARSSDPQLAADIANAHVTTFDQYSRGLLMTGTKQASTALSAEFAAAEKALQEADAAVYKFQKDNDLIAVSLEDRQNLVSAKIVTYSGKYDDAHSRAKELESKLQILRQIANGSDVVDSPILSMGESSAFDTMRADYYTARNEFEQLQKEVGPKTIEYAKAKSRVETLRQTLEAEAKRVVGAAEKQHQAAVAFEREMLQEVEKYKKDALDLGPTIVSYNSLMRLKKSAEDRYNILVGRLSSSEMSGRLNKDLDTNVRPLDAALVPTVPISPNLRVNILTASALALVLGFGVILLIVFLDRTVKSAEDAQASAVAPILGVVPVLAEIDGQSIDDRGRDLYVHEHPKSQVAEACRSLRTNIVFSSADRPFKTLVVSSANPREGKTTLVIYLGTTMAQAGERVLLVDTDMRRPRLHVSMGVPRGIGLSNLIVGDGKYEDAIKSSGVPNLFVLPCGPLPPNPAELLMSKRFNVVLEELATRFDRIILDSPPLGAVTDAVVLSKQTDGVALVVQASKTLRDEVKRSVRQIRHVDGKIVGVILNQLSSHDRRYGYYNYYGYGEERPKEPASAS